MIKTSEQSQQLKSHNTKYADFETKEDSKLDNVNCRCDSESDVAVNESSKI